MHPSSDRAASPRWLPRALSACPPSAALAIAIVIALVIRLYLSLTSYCIAGDGVAYLGMAREFAAGLPAKALASVFSPLYPWLVAGAHRLIPDWELAGNLVSAILGTATVATVYLMTRAAFTRTDLALGAAVLTAIHPDLAAYSASVRTEAGFIFLLTAAFWLLISGLNRRRIALVAAAGLIGGLAYLYRTEAIGLLLFTIAFIPAAALWWRRWSFTWATVAAAAFAAAFLIVAAPYLIFLRETTGHWSVGREFTAAMMYGMGEVAPNTLQWQRLGYSTSVSPFAPIFSHPALYLEKVAGDFFASLEGFVQALGALLTLLLIAGLWRRGRALLDSFAETMLASFTAFYLVGFAFSYTGTRFMVHYIPFTFGWVMLGLEAASAAFNRLIDRIALAHRTDDRSFRFGILRVPRRRRPQSAPGTVSASCNPLVDGRSPRRLPQSALAIALVLILLPQTLWPIGYDMRGVRYAGAEIARRTAGQSAVVVARDGRFAYYAGARFILLPTATVPDLCSWLQSPAAAPRSHAGAASPPPLDPRFSSPADAISPSPADAISRLHAAPAQSHAAPIFLILGNRDERRFGLIAGPRSHSAGLTTTPRSSGPTNAPTRCLSFIQRYPRYGAGFYDLFAVRPSK